MNPTDTLTETTLTVISKVAYSPTGAKAGIAIGVLAVVLAVGLGIFFFFRRGGKAARAREQVEQEEFLRQNRMRDVPPDTYEMLTKDNRHEMLTKHNISQLDVPGPIERKPLGGLEALPVVGVAELDGLRGVDGGGVGEGEGAGKVVGGDEGRWERREVGEQDEERLGFLKERILKLRVEKERLKRIQELEDMEETTRRQIAGLHGQTENGEVASNGRIQELEEMEEGMKWEILDTELRRVAGN
ncbi:hypothetical protein ACEPPN_013520 [Leptodophora sp. 'Broadleaf-Isolate-01']